MDHVDRMKDEIFNLNKMIDRGYLYFDNHQDDKLLSAQLAAMRAYRDILSLRLNDYN